MKRRNRSKPVVMDAENSELQRAVFAWAQQEYGDETLPPGVGYLQLVTLFHDAGAPGLNRMRRRALAASIGPRHFTQGARDQAGDTQRS